MSPGSGWAGDSPDLELALEEESREKLKLQQALETCIRDGRIWNWLWNTSRAALLFPMGFCL